MSNKNTVTVAKCIVTSSDYGFDVGKYYQVESIDELDLDGINYMFVYNKRGNVIHIRCDRFDIPKQTTVGKFRGNRID